MFLVCHFLSLEMETYWSCIMRTSYSKFHSNLILVPPHKPLDPMMDLYDGHNFDLKTRVDIWMRIDVVPLE